MFWVNGDSVACNEAAMASVRDWEPTGLGSEKLRGQQGRDAVGASGSGEGAGAVAPAAALPAEQNSSCSRDSGSPEDTHCPGDGRARRAQVSLQN